eukprot:GILI01033209.1.p1 GENE.GILI01033209.1~~GILI01033209.1.p1  ORF type:complete len:290 (-),score=32.27 GILI01033209.1:83-952(-)
MELIDCHAHVSYPELQDDLDDLISAAVKAGVNRIITVSSNMQDSQPCMDLCRRYPDIISACIGLHPVQEPCRSARPDEVGDIINFIREHAKSIVGVGEIGLDYTQRALLGDVDIVSAAAAASLSVEEMEKRVQQESTEMQLEVFRSQIRVAKELGLPVNCHSRNAGHYVIDVLKEEGVGPHQALLHAFDGRSVYALKAAQEGYMFSVPPSAVRSDAMKKLIQALPLDNIVLETDSPALPPVARERNVPANILVSAQVVAKVKNLSLEDVARITSENARKIFSRLPSASA